MYLVLPDLQEAPAEPSAKVSPSTSTTCSSNSSSNHHSQPEHEHNESSDTDSVSDEYEKPSVLSPINGKRSASEALPELIKLAKKKPPNQPSSTFQEEVRKACLGHFSLKMQNLEHSDHQIRSLDTKFVDQLVVKMKEYADEGAAPPIVHLKKPKVDFKANAANGFKYEVLGGQHMVAALKILAEQDDHFKTRMCVVYGDLSPEAKVWLSNQHNLTGSFRHHMTFKDKVLFCRAWRGTSGKSEKDWAKSCQEVLQFKRQEQEIVLNFAGRSQTTIDLFETMIKKFEEGLLKNQKLSKKQIATGTPDIAVSKFKNLVKLSEESAQVLLQEVVDGDRDIPGMVNEAETINKLKVVQDNLLKSLKISSWAEAVQRFPHKTDRDTLLVFKDECFSKGPSTRFSGFLRELSDANCEAESLTKTVVTKKDTKAFLLHSDAKDLSIQELNTCVGSLSPVALTVLDAPEGWTRKDVEEFLVGYKNLILERETPDTVLAIIGSLGFIEERARPVVDDDFFFANELLYVVNSHVKTNAYIQKCVDGVLLAFYSQSTDHSLKRHVSRKGNNSIIVTEMEARERFDGEVVLQDQKPMQLMEDLVHRLTTPGQVILDACSGTGTMAVAAMKHGRHSVSVEIDEKVYTAGKIRVRKSGIM